MFYEKREIPFHCNQGPVFDFLPHLHRDIEILFLMEGATGCIVVEVDGVTREMKPGDVAVSFPNTLHSYETPKEDEGLCCLLIFEPELVNDYQIVLTQQKPAYPFLTQEQVHPDVWYSLEQLVSHNNNLWSKRRELLKGHLLVILSHLMEPMAMKTIESRAYSVPVERLLLYVDAHFLEPLTLDIVAREIGVSKYYVSRLFSEKIGYSFPEYLNILRIQHACRLLSTTEKSVTDVGFASGFNSSSTFYRVFREKTGVTPLDYRNECKTED